MNESSALQEQGQGYWQIASETNLVLFLPPPITLDKQKKCWALYDVIESMEDVAEVVIGMNTLSVFTSHLSWDKLNTLKDKLSALDDLPPKSINGKHIEIPVRYGGRYGADLQPMATALDINVHDLIKQHTGALYTVYFIGFQPGFPYLGGLPESLHFARHATPRTHVPAGAVGIGGAQTGVYPFASPGGWQILGQTDTKLFDIHQSPPALLAAGDTLQFVAIDIDE